LRRSVLLAVCVVSLLGGASSAAASTLAWEGTMTLDLGRLGKVSQTGTGVSLVGATPGGILNTLRLAGGITIANATLSNPSDPISVRSAKSVMATLGTGTLRGFSAPGPLMWDALPLPGMARFCFIAGCDNSPTIPFFTETTATPSRLGEGVGLGGFLTRMGLGAGTTVVTLSGAGWQTSVASLFTASTQMSVMMSGFVHGATSQTQVSVSPGLGLLQMVTPTQFTTQGPGGTQEKIALFTTLTIQFVPEPGILIGALTGVAAVALLAVSRTRSGNRTEPRRKQ
jgi:hypothetical protein